MTYRTVKVPKTFEYYVKLVKNHANICIRVTSRLSKTSQEVFEWTRRDYLWYLPLLYLFLWGWRPYAYNLSFTDSFLSFPPLYPFTKARWASNHNPLDFPCRPHVNFFVSSFVNSGRDQRNFSIHIPVSIYRSFSLPSSTTYIQKKTEGIFPLPSHENLRWHGNGWLANFIVNVILFVFGLFVFFRTFHSCLLSTEACWC